MNIDEGCFLPFSFYIKYETSKGIFNSKDIIIELDPNISFQETRSIIIKRQEIPDYREKNIEVNLMKLRNYADTSPAFKNLFPDNNTKIVLEITISFPKAITVYYIDKSYEIPVDENDDFFHPFIQNVERSLI